MMARYELRVERCFDAAHYLWNYDGKCSRLHGHTWRVEATVVSGVLDQRGMAYDFLDLKKILRAAVEPFDHNCLNEVPPFKEGNARLNPTAENIARIIYERINRSLAGVPTVRVKAVRVWESSHSSVTYYPEHPSRAKRPLQSIRDEINEWDRF